MIKKTFALLLSLSMLPGVCAFAEEHVNTLKDIAPGYDVGIFEDKISKALTLEITDDIKDKLNENITRGEFCGYVYNMLNQVKELPVAKLAENPFNDVMDYKINGLYIIDVVSGKDDRIFAPDDLITREEAAVILHRAAKYLDVELPQAKVDISYSDNDKISPWAVSDVYGLKLLNIIEDVDGMFNPKGSVTYESAVNSIMKLYEIAKK